VLELERSSGVSLAHQIATGIRYRIATGRIAPGAALPSYRAAALEWGVNLHTVRRAYLDLARADLVRIDDRRGAVVLGPPLVPGDDALARFSAEVVRVAEERFGAGIEDLIGAIRRGRPAPAGPPSVWVVECSAALADSLADQVGRWWAVEAKSWLVSRAAEIPSGVVLSTYFHFDELRRLLPARAPDLEVARIRPALALLDALRDRLARSRTRRLVLVDGESSIARSFVHDLTHYIGGQVQIDVVSPREVATRGRSSFGRAPLLVSPRDWDRAAGSLKGRPGVYQLEYEIDAGDLARIAARHGWKAADTVTRQGAAS
jgi:DNA-binding transcriptional regulator YhcF (GntR family)